MSRIYTLHHLGQFQDKDLEDLEEIKTVGVYSSEAKAHEAAEQLRDVAGFRDGEGEFEVSWYELGRIEWAEGFVSWAQALDEQGNGGE